MTLPDDHTVARTCKPSSVDQPTRKPTPASFEFRPGDGAWKDKYLSVNWLEFLHKEEGDVSAKIATLRAYLLSDHGLPIFELKAKGMIAAIYVRTIHQANLEKIETTLQCRHEPRAEGDPHSGIHPDPGVDHWPVEVDAPAHLAVQQILFLSMYHWEGARPAAPANVAATPGV